MNSNFQDRLKNFEVDPPAGLWDKIGSVLENRPEIMIAEKLVQFEMDPPSGSWAKISKRLYTNPSGSRRPVKRILLYGSIAACIIIAIVSVNLLTGEQSTTNEVIPAAVTSEKRSNNPASKETTVIQNNIAAITPANQLVAAVKKMVNKGYSFVRKYPAAIHENLMNTVSSIDQFMPDYASRNEQIPYTDDGNKYMVFASEDGNAVKLPKKIYGSFACPSDDTPCRDKLRLLQQKLASGSLNSDFAGMLDILTTIEDH
jgi:hypothetical protein